MKMWSGVDVGNILSGSLSEVGRYKKQKAGREKTMCYGKNVI